MKTAFTMNLYVKESPALTSQSRNKDKKSPNRRFLLLLLFCIVTAAYYWLSMSTDPKEDFIVIKDGEPELAPWRKEKLQKELEELDDAEQYVLIAGLSGYYSCYNCPGETTIFLEAGEVWKYGVTTKGEKQRYRAGLPAEELIYLVQFRGSLQECLKQEKIKIYNYAVLPENLKRAKPLIRPPGNKLDR